MLKAANAPPSNKEGRLYLLVECRARAQQRGGGEEQTFVKKGKEAEKTRVGQRQEDKKETATPECVRV